MRFHTSHLTHHVSGHSISGHSLGHVAQHHANSGFHFPSFQDLFNSFAHSMMRHIGGRVINALPIALVLVIAGLIGAYALYKYTRKG